MTARINTVVLLGLIFSIALFSEGCRKDDLPENPFDGIEPLDTTANQIPIDTVSFSYVHKKIFEPKCANPGCHDGAFEPDFRNVQSAYATLVYHQVIKNNTNEDFTYRVVPYDTTYSVLHERLTNCCFVNVNDRMPQDNIGVPLPDSDIRLIENWIMSGAPDMFGQIPTEPDNFPNVGYYLASNYNYTFHYSNDRIDSNYLNSFIVPKDSVFNFLVIVDDDKTEVCDLQVNELKFSYTSDFASITQTIPTACLNVIGTSDYVWGTTVDVSQFTPGSTVYMRYYVNDGEHTQNTEFPNDNSFEGYKTYWSFYVKP